MTRWTRPWLRLSSNTFRTSDSCKTTISTAARAITAWASELDASGERFHGRTGKSALWCKLGLRRLGEHLVPRAAGGPSQLKPTQQRVVAALRADPAADLTRAHYEKLAGVSRSQAAYDLAELVEVGILERFGNGRATRYRLAREGGAQRHWTSERIRTELEAFCGTRETWPSAADFRAAGRGDLYVAASRYGGIAHWTEALGFVHPNDRASAAPQPFPYRARLVWAGAGALAALGVAAAAIAIFVTLYDHGARVTTAAAKSGQAPRATRAAHDSLRAVTTRGAAKKASHAQRTEHHRVRRPSTARSRARSSRSLPGHPASQSSSTSALAGTRTFSAFTPAPSGPAPLRAPSGGSGPNPLKAP
jgi:hypothetical protein